MDPQSIYRKHGIGLGPPRPTRIVPPVTTDMLNRNIKSCYELRGLDIQRFNQNPDDGTWTSSFDFEGTQLEMCFQYIEELSLTMYVRHGERRSAAYHSESWKYFQTILRVSDWLTEIELHETV